MLDTLEIVLKATILPGWFGCSSFKKPLSFEIFPMGIPRITSVQFAGKLRVIFLTLFVCYSENMSRKNKGPSQMQGTVAAAHTICRCGISRDKRESHQSIWSWGHSFVAYSYKLTSTNIVPYDGIASIIYFTLKSTRPVYAQNEPLFSNNEKAVWLREFEVVVVFKFTFAPPLLFIITKHLVATEVRLKLPATSHTLFACFFLSSGRDMQSEGSH